MNIDCLKDNVAEGDFVTGLFLYHEGEVEEEVDYLVMAVFEKNKNEFLVTLAYHTADTEYMDRDDYNLEEVTLEMRMGDRFVVDCDRMQIMENGMFFQPFISKYKVRPTRRLVGSGKNATRSDIEAKFEAYCDPCVAALCETNGRLTRQRFYAIK